MKLFLNKPTFVSGTVAVDHHFRLDGRGRRGDGRFDWPDAVFRYIALLVHAAVAVFFFLDHHRIEGDRGRRPAGPLDDVVDQPVHGGHHGGGRPGRARGRLGRRVLRVRRVLGRGRRQRGGRDGRGHVHELRRHVAGSRAHGRLGRRGRGQRHRARRRQWRQRSIRI